MAAKVDNRIGRALEAMAAGRATYEDQKRILEDVAALQARVRELEAENAQIKERLDDARLAAHERDWRR